VNELCWAWLWLVFLLALMRPVLTLCALLVSFWLLQKPCKCGKEGGKSKSMKEKKGKGEGEERREKAGKDENKREEREKQEKEKRERGEEGSRR